MSTRQLLEQLEKTESLSKRQFVELIAGSTSADREYARKRACDIRDACFGKKIYVRGLIEFSNYCKNDCYYCGIRRGNRNVARYRLTEEEIFSCCEVGERLGFRTFVLQGGEDAAYTDERVVQLVRAIKERHPDCAITLSIGERERESYEKFFAAGVDRYLLRHETASDAHYRKLHPPELSSIHRKQCLRQLKEIGFQTGCGFMVGSPEQTAEELAEDFLFIHELQPEMVGIGPFIPHQDTPFADKAGGTLEQTLFLLSLLRIMQKDVLLPATTALATIHPNGREQGILAGANVVMPNLSPVDVRRNYALYDGKRCMGDEAAEGCDSLRERFRKIGYEMVVDRGDAPSFTRGN